MSHAVLGFAITASVDQAQDVALSSGSDPVWLPEEATPEVVADYARNHGLVELIGENPIIGTNSTDDTKGAEGSRPFPPDWPDLVRLHMLILSRKVTTVLEIGVGHSTLVMAHALAINQREFGHHVTQTLRRANPFELHTVDDMSEFVAATERALPNSLRSHVTFHRSECHMGLFGGRICTFYSRFPNICPDFVYLDGPSQGSVSGDVRGVSTRHSDRLPMSADLLAIEHFMLPGTMILVDGRSANARFLAANFQRRWSYRHHPAADIHTFEMIEPPLGPYNRTQIEFSLGADWLDLS